MKPEELAKKVLSEIKDKSIDYSVWSSSGKCDGWDGETDVFFSAGQILYHINESIGMDELFDGMNLKELNLEKELKDAVMEAAQPDGGPSASMTGIDDAI